MSQFLGIVSALLVVACAGPAQNQSVPTGARDTTSAEARAEKRRQRRAVRDLETQITKLKAEMTMMRRGQGAPVGSISSPQPTLPVEVLEPDVEHSAPAYDVPQEEYVVAGFDENGVEILYVGDAARTPPVKPSIDLAARSPAPAAAPSETPRLSNQSRPRDPQQPRLQPVPHVDDNPLVASAAIGPKVNALVVSDSPQPPPVIPAIAAPSPPVEEPVEASSPKDEYRVAYEALKGRRHDEAIELFRAFLVAHPRHPYADNAQYWLGEAFYDLRQFSRAKEEFLKVVSEHPSGNKVPAAKLKAAYCHLALGDQERAKKLLADLVALHPNTGPANLASEKLKSL